MDVHMFKRYKRNWAWEGNRVGKILDVIQLDMYSNVQVVDVSETVLGIYGVIENWHRILRCIIINDVWRQPP